MTDGLAGTEWDAILLLTVFWKQSGKHTIKHVKMHLCCDATMQQINSLQVVNQHFFKKFQQGHTKISSGFK